MEWLARRMDYLKEQTKQESRELVADLFHAEDATRTRMVETMGFLFKLTKDPKRAQTVKYTKVLEELQDKLTPELLQVLESLVAKHTTLQAAKPPALTATDLRKNPQYAESVGETSAGILESRIGDFLGKLKNVILDWGRSYDQRLDRLKDIIESDGQLDT
jgi:hypothetical protein